MTLSPRRQELQRLYMNRILFEADEIDAAGNVVLFDERAEHIRAVLRLSVGGVIRSGILNGLGGTSRILEVDASHVKLATEHTQVMPSPWFDLLLAAPRPKVMKRLWPQLAALGVRRVVVVNAAKVEKCYFSSQWMNERAYRPLLIEGLTQAGRTTLPEVFIRNRFKPFIEDELAECFPTSQRLLAHPGARSKNRLLTHSTDRPLMAIGPEGGWTEYELALFADHGFQNFSLGTQTLRTDTACVALIAVLGWLCCQS